MKNPLTPEEREWYRTEGVAQGIYDRHAAVMEKSGTHVPKWGWLAEEQREKWRDLARERAAVGMDSKDGFEGEVDW